MLWGVLVVGLSMTRVVEPAHLTKPKLKLFKPKPKPIRKLTKSPNIQRIHTPIKVPKLRKKPLFEQAELGSIYNLKSVTKKLQDDRRLRDYKHRLTSRHRDRNNIENRSFSSTLKINGLLKKLDTFSSFNKQH